MEIKCFPLRTKKITGLFLRIKNNDRTELIVSKWFVVQQFRGDSWSRNRDYKHLYDPFNKQTFPAAVLSIMNKHFG